MNRIIIVTIFILPFVFACAGENKRLKNFDRKKMKIEDNWSAKEYKPNDSEQIWYFRKNIGASNLIGHPDLEYQIYFTIHYTPHDSRGLPSKEDNKILYDFEEFDVPDIETASNSIHVASVLKNGVKDLIFYSSDPDQFLKEVNKISKRIIGLEVELDYNLDPKWEIYSDFP